MKLKAFNTLLLFLCSTATFAQYRISGKVLSSKENAGLAGCVVYLNDNKSTAVTNAKGEFAFGGLKEGNYLLLAKHINHKQAERAVTVNASTGDVTIILEYSENELE